GPPPRSRVAQPVTSWQPLSGGSAQRLSLDLAGAPTWERRGAIHPNEGPRPRARAFVRLAASFGGHGPAPPAAFGPAPVRKAATPPRGYPSATFVTRSVRYWPC